MIKRERDMKRSLWYYLIIKRLHRLKHIALAMLGLDKRERGGEEGFFAKASTQEMTKRAIISL